MSTQVLTELPNIQYAGMDYENVIQEIKKIIKNNPKWSENWDEFSSSEGGMVFIQLMSWICDNLSTRQDTLYNEQYLSTASKKSSKIRLLKTIGYKPALSHAAQVPIIIEFENILENDFNIVEGDNPAKDSLTLRLGKIPKLTGLDINGKSTYWEILPLSGDKPDYLGGITLEKGLSRYTSSGKKEDKETIYAIQGETKYKEMYTDTSDGPFINISEKNVADNSIRVYIKSSNSNKECKEVSSFVSQEAVSKEYGIPYIIEHNEDETLKIKFSPKGALKEDRLLPAGTTVSIFYRVTNGNLGNIPPKFLNTTYVFSDALRNKKKAAIFNDTLAYGGTNNEELEKAVLNAPLTLRTLDRAVTPEDFDILINANTSILKSKTYTASNIPDKFKEHYGRYINPQEAFTFTMLNKPFFNVPTKQYNNFPWISLTKMNRLNEKYSFGNGKINDEIKIGNTYHNFTSITTSGIKDFNNATVFDLGNNFNRKIKDNRLNEDFQLKLNVEKSNISIFDKIGYTLLSKVDNTIVTDLNDNADIQKNDNARFISESSYGNDYTIDVSKNRYINCIIDGRAEVKIDLCIQRGEFTTSPFYVKFDNVPTSTDPSPESTDIFSSINRKGIVQLINEQFVALSEGTASDQEAVGLFDKNASYQYMGIREQKEENPVINFSDTVPRKDLIINIDDKTLDFVITKEDSYNGIMTYSKLVEVLNNNIKTKKNIFELNDADGTWKPIEDMYIEFGITKSLSLKDNNYTSFDIYIKSNGHNTLDVSYKNSIIEGVPEVNGYAEINSASMIHQMFYGGVEDIQEEVSYIGILGANYPATDYSNISKMLKDPEDEKLSYFSIISPSVGKASSIQFRYDEGDSPSTKSPVDIAFEGNLMKDFFKLKFDVNRNSYKAIGIKRVCLLKDTVTSSYYEDENGNKNFPTEDVVLGNIIFSNSCIYNNYDFKKIYASYKFSDIKKLVIGSVYDNFYYTGNETIDNKMKQDKEQFGFVKPTGVVLKNGDIDYTKSNIEIKFTKNIVEGNSFYSIKENDNNSLDVIGVGRTEIETADISGDNKISEDSTLLMSLDELSPEEAWEIKILKDSTGESIASSIKKSILETSALSEEGESVYEDYVNNFNSVVSRTFESNNKLLIKSISKSNFSNISFYCKTGEIERTKKFYKEFLGTSISNSKLYKLYPVSVIDDNNIFAYDENNNIINVKKNSKGEIESKEYWYAPVESFPLIFKYRKMVNEVSRGPDYYISYEGGNYILNKTENSSFPSEDFYLHVINDRSDSNIKTDEQDLNKYMNNKKISGMDLTWFQPYIRTYDISAEVKYNANFSEDSIKSKVEEAVKNLCSLENAEIAGIMSKAMIIKAIMNCDGVENVTLNYFGLDFTRTDSKEYGDVQEIQSPFFGISCLADYVEEKHGLLINYKIFK